MKKLIILISLILLSSGMLSCEMFNYDIAVLPEQIPAQRLELSEDIFDRLDDFSNERLFYISENEIIYSRPILSVVSNISQYSSELVFYDGNEEVYENGNVDYVIGKDENNGAIYYLYNSDIHHTGNVAPEDEWKFTENIQPYKMASFISGASIFDFHGNLLNPGVSGTLRFFLTSLNSDIYYVSYVNEWDTNTCVIKSYVMGDNQPYSTHRLPEGYECGSVSAANDDIMVFSILNPSSVFTSQTVVGYFSINREGIVHEYYPGDFVPNSDQLSISFYLDSSLPRAFQIEEIDALPYILIFSDTMSRSALVQFIPFQDYLYFDDEYTVIRAEDVYQIFRGDTLIVEDPIPSGQLSTEKFIFSNSHVVTSRHVLIDSYESYSTMKIYNQETQELEMECHCAPNYFMGNEKDKFLYYSLDTISYHLYDTFSHEDLDLGEQDRTYSLGIDYFLLLSGNKLSILDVNTLQVIETEYVSAITSRMNAQGPSSQYDYPFIPDQNIRPYALLVKYHQNYYTIRLY